MSTFSGPQYPKAMRDHREDKRKEAKARNADTPVERRRSTREGVWDEKTGKRGRG